MRNQTPMGPDHRDNNLPEVIETPHNVYAPPTNPHDSFIDNNKFAGPMDISTTASVVSAAASPQIPALTGSSAALIGAGVHNVQHPQHADSFHPTTVNSPVSHATSPGIQVPPVHPMSPPPMYQGAPPPGARPPVLGHTPSPAPQSPASQTPHQPNVPQQPSPSPQQQGVPPQQQAQPQLQQPSAQNGQVPVATTPLVSLQSKAAPVLCPNCSHFGLTAITAETGGFTHMIAAVVCCVTACGCIPYFIKGLKDVRHACSQCNIPLAKYHRSGRTEVLVRVIQNSMPLQQQGYQHIQLMQHHSQQQYVIQPMPLPQISPQNFGPMQPQDYQQHAPQQMHHATSQQFYPQQMMPHQVQAPTYPSLISQQQAL